MQYRSFGKTGDKVSILGYGCMRFPRTGGKFDLERTEKQIMMAFEAGVNYFDTAFVYFGSEAALGEILEKRQIRDKVKIATKIPPYMISNRDSMENTLSTQLKHLRTDYIDYYLVHALNDMTGWEKVKTSGLMTFLEEKKREGVIRHIGFSYHGDKINFKKIVDDYNWDHCLVQYNYIDENSQAGREGILYARSAGLGVAIMEPLRGGLLAGNVPDPVKEIWEKASVKRSCAEWALRWLWNQPEIDVVLSGMNEEEQIAENVRVAHDSEVGTLTGEELALFNEARDAYLAQLKIGCTGCSYCVPCPAGVNIPICFSRYNDHHLYRPRFSKVKFLVFLGDVTGSKSALPSNCNECGKCDERCPQHLPVREYLKTVKNEMEPWWSKPFLGLIRFMLKLKNAFSPK